MRVFIQGLKANLLLAMKQFPVLALAFLLMPLVLSFFMASSFQNLYAVKPEELHIAVKLNNQDRGPVGASLVSTFKQLDQVGVIDLTTDQESADFTLIFSETLSRSLQDKQAASQIKLILAKNASQWEGVLLKDLLNQLLQVQEQEQALVEGTGSKEEAQAMIRKSRQAVQDLVFQHRSVDGRQAPTSHQYFAIVYLAFLFVMFFNNMLVSATKPEFSAFYKRLNLLPGSLVSKQAMMILSDLLTYTLFVQLYMLIWKGLDPTVFQGSWLAYLLVSMAFILLFINLAQLLSHFFVEKAAAALNMFNSLLMLVFTGALPLNRLANLPSLNFLEENWLKSSLIEPFLAIHNGQAGLAILPILAILLVISGFIFAASIAVIRRKEAY
ncbi:ABC transporter permease [Vaginisenegalia massiliensis]|uniref:ABC transporter permease n=1 Tax=Vaginisenegalia massiliensis TaxID=2058294 RepID=UPI000F537F21|nr:ABC transporter permease [Vaginisenegalia massiliensis]